MTISAALSNAMSGLTAASRRADVVAANVANALTEGYGRRDVQLSARSLAGNGAGVQIVSVTRTSDRVVLNARRDADAGHAASSVQAGFLSRMETVLGLPGDAASLSGRADALGQALIEAESRPDVSARLARVVQTAGALAEGLRSASTSVQSARMDADQQIARQVTQLNDGLARIAALNGDIRLQRAAGRDATALMDQRQQAVDAISAIVPMREMARDGDQIALYTPSGVALLDGRPATIGFAAVGVITPDMTVQSGALSGLTINGRAMPVPPAPPASGGQTAAGPLAGGSLGALFTLRDDLAPQAQIRIDGLARDLIERFQDPALLAGATGPLPGLFTDQGAVFDPLNEVGVAGRIAVNAAVDPDAGGDLWRLRSGIAATAPGEVGDAAYLSLLRSALTDLRVGASAGPGTPARSLSGQAAEALSGIAAARLSAEETESFAAARADTLRQTELEGGVDSDAELQTLLLVEQAYSANARVIQAVDSMMQTLIDMI